VAARRSLDLETPLGLARAHLHPSIAPVATLVLGHGAGRGSDTADLLGLAETLPDSGISVVRLDQPWVVAGRRVAPPPAALDRAALAAVPQLPLDGALLLGGRSAGARVACRTAAALGATGVLALAFPLHPPGRPERSRADELRRAGVPVLVLQGERDAFGRPHDIVAAVGDAQVEVHPVAGADHSLRAGVGAALTALVAAWGIGRST
jgi:predicted alpha/beta-hydrolase family hydrolase